MNYARSAEQAEQVAKEVNAAQGVKGKTVIVSHQCRRKLTNSVYHLQSSIFSQRVERERSCCDLSELIDADLDVRVSGDRCSYLGADRSVDCEEQHGHRRILKVPQQPLIL